jgi:hypothetical protein
MEEFYIMDELMYFETSRLFTSVRIVCLSIKEVCP